jgi:hypothetical protein
VRAYAVALLVAACGRVGFDAVAGGDAASSDARGDGVAATGCAAKSYELCDGFEGASFATYWTVNGAALDATVAHRGSQSVHVQLPALLAGNGAESVISEAQTLALADPVFYVRAYVRFGSLPAGNNGMEVISAENNNFSSEDALFVYNVDLGVYEQWNCRVADNATPPPVNTWLCLLFTVTRSTTAGQLALGGDVPPAVLSAQPTDGSPTLSDLYFGLQLAAPNAAVDQPAIDAWIDDVIVDRAPITCAD